MKHIGNSKLIRYMYQFQSVSQQKTLFDCFNDLLSEEAVPSTSEECSKECDTIGEDASGGCEVSGNVSTCNWFDNLDEGDFNLVDMNT